MKLEAFDKVPARSLTVRNMEEQQDMGLMNFGDREMREALSVLEHYRAGKKVLEETIKEEDLWWRRRHLDMFKTEKGEQKRIPAGAQLFNAIENKIADICDNIPECSFLARSEDDEKTADLLTSVMPALLEQNDMEAAFRAVTREKVTHGTGIYAVTWDQSKLNGIGDVSIMSVSPLQIYCEPGVTDLQKSPALFYVYFENNEVLLSEYPELEDKLGHGGYFVEEKYAEDTVDNTRRSAVIDYYYKRKVGTRTVLHYAKICADTVLYASENDPEYAERGWYDHGRYPFEGDVMFPLPGSPFGFGYVRVGKDQQYQIDKLNNAIVRNAIIASTRRKYIKKNAGVNKEQLMDIENDIVEIDCSGNISDAVTSIEEPPLSGNYISILQNLEETMKEVTSNRDFSNGGTAGGVTSGTAISALVEAGNKQSRTIIRGSYDAYKRAVTLCFELYRQFGDQARMVRIKGADGATQYATFSNESIAAVPQEIEGEEIGQKEPVFDIMVRPHKKSPFARVTQNSMMQEFYGAGFFAPENATQALACLEGMEFDGKEALQRRIEQNGTIFAENVQLKQTLLRLAAMIDAQNGTDLTRQMAGDFGVEVPQAASAGGGDLPVQESPDIMRTETDPRMQKAAEKIADSTSV